MAKAVEEPLLRNESHESHKTVEQMLVRTYDNNKDIDVLVSLTVVQKFSTVSQSTSEKHRTVSFSRN